MGLSIDPAWMIASFAVGTLGMGFFVYGKKQLRYPQLATGLTLMVYPYFVTSPLWMLCIGGAVLAGLWGALRAGL